MTFTRVALGLGAVVVLAFVVLMAVAVGGEFTPLVAVAALLILIGGGNLLYGRHSHGAAAQARVRPAQEAQNRAIDEAQAEARRQREQVRQRRAQARRPLLSRRTGAGTGTRTRTRTHPHRRGPHRMSLFRDTGVVLRTYRLGEADRIIVLMTESHGKVRAVAKGVRKTSSKFGARLEPLTHVDVLFWQGRSDLDIINQVEVVETFRHVREDLHRVAKGLSLLEVTDQIAQERHPDRRLFAMLVGALRALADNDRDPTLLAPSFFLKALALEGASPVLDACASCGEPDGAVDLVAFDLVEGGTLCRRCRRGRPMSAPALVLLRRILGGDLGAVLAGPPPEGADEVAELATEAMEIHLDRRIRSVRSAVGL